MSGTSLDGLDLILAGFTQISEKWKFTILKSETNPYIEAWKQELSSAGSLDGLSLIRLHKEYGRYLGQQVNLFLKDVSIRPHLVASHGHTIFHQPQNHLTFQLGDGNTLAAVSGIPVVFDFRSLDVALGGQGAPLAPMGDRLLFPEYTYCLNLGGFANISFERQTKRIAFDPCPANLAVQHIVQPMGMDLDRDGETGRHGKIDTLLLTRLNELDYYHKSAPKSLGREWLESFFFPVLDSFDIPAANKLRTVYEHITMQICGSITPNDKEKMLVTGGGAHNVFLTDLLKEKCRAEVVIPTDTLVDFKEALIFAFIGILRKDNKINCLSSVTGATKDSSSGIIVNM